MGNNRVSEIENARKCWLDSATRMKLKGVYADAVRFLESNQICEVGLWRLFVDQFRIREDNKDRRWRCEYWGKMMRGASMIVKYTQDAGLYRILEDSVRDILTVQDDLGRISTYEPGREYLGWDMWGKKYVLLGMQYFLEICRDEKLEREVIASMCRQVDYMIGHIGTEDGKTGICETSPYWKGLNSCSVLEPIVRLYRLTGDQKYFDFATYIVSTGFVTDGDLIQLAYEDRLAPYQYPVTKAYEMMSCFEGLIRYYYLTGIEKYKIAVLNFGKKLIETDISIIGCGGCTHELFDHTAVMQTKCGYEGVMQETCVGVTWMKLAAELLQLSGDPIWADCIEQTFFNNYLGAMNTHRVLRAPVAGCDVPQVMPFDSYSPLTPDIRGRAVGGYCSLPGSTYYGCCACIGAAGAGVIPQMAVLRNAEGIMLQFYAGGEIYTQTPKGNGLYIKAETDYPKDGKISLTFYPDAEELFAVSFRIPAWCKNATVTVNGEAAEVTDGYTVIARRWRNGDRAEIDLPMPVERLLPPEGAENADLFAAYRRGPIVLAADKRVTDPDRPIAIKSDKTGTVRAKQVCCPEIPDCIECFEMECEDGHKVRLIDYASAGKTWADDSKCAVWLYRKNRKETSYEKSRGK